MTKAELINAMDGMPDDAKVNVECIAVGDSDCWPDVSGVQPFDDRFGYITLEIA